MFTLILTLLVGPNKTIEVDLHTAAPSVNACMMDQVSMAKYIGEHPGKITKWHCVKQGQEANL